MNAIAMRVAHILSLETCIGARIESYRQYGTTRNNDRSNESSKRIIVLVFTSEGNGHIQVLVEVSHGKTIYFLLDEVQCLFLIKSEWANQTGDLFQMDGTVIV